MCTNSAVATKEATGAPVHEIEVTPEMIEAGADVLREYFTDLGSVMAEVLAADVIREAAKRHEPKNY